ncbi:MAG: short-subunit dehydrogenase [Pseudoalteromonas distincta]|jgi:short-subunit dehydrogenase
MRQNTQDALSGRVIAITGASAGVGRATALAAARAGASLLLMARSQTALEAVADEVRGFGVQAHVAALDVADAEAVRQAAHAGEQALGAIDVWVNSAMVTVFSPIAKLAPEEIAQVTRVTYLGSVHGAMAALEVMRGRDRGVIVQVGSALAYRGIPLQAPYCAAKHAIRGFLSSLRAELLHEGSGIKVSEVHLPAVNTPQFDWARAHAAKRPKPVGDIYAPEVAAEAILRAAKDPQREYWLGASTAQTIIGQSVAPQLMDRLMADMAWDGQFTDQAFPPDYEDNLFETVEKPHRTEGRFSGEQKHQAPLIAGGPARAGVVAAGALAFAGLGLLVGRFVGR